MVEKPSKKKKEDKKVKEKSVKDLEDVSLTPVLALTPVSEREPKTAEEYEEERKGSRRAAQSPLICMPSSQLRDWSEFASVDGVESVASVESVESVDDVASVESVDGVASVESVDGVASVESVESVTHSSSKDRALPKATKDKKSRKDRVTKVPKGLSTTSSIYATLPKKSGTISVSSSLSRLSTASSIHATPSKRTDIISSVSIAPGSPKLKSAPGSPKLKSAPGSPKLKAPGSPKLKQPTKRSTRRRKKLKSRPMKETSIMRLAKKVKSRKPRIPQPDIPRSVDEDPYPRPRYDKKKKKKKQRIEDEFVPQIDTAFIVPEADMFTQLPVATVEEVAFKPSGVTLPNTGLPMVQGNSDNNGLIMVKGQPFWFTEIPPDITDDELVMNAAVLIDVLENRMKLVPMPDIEYVDIFYSKQTMLARIVLDPMEEKEVLSARDSSCYTKEVIFGNTVRSMVNLNELSIHSLSLKGRKTAVQPVGADELTSLAIEEPTELHEYYRATYDRSTAVPFKPTPKTQKIQPHSCGSDADSDSSKRDAQPTSRRDAQ